MINLQKTTTTSNNGQVFRSYDMDGVLHGSSLIPELIPLSIFDLEANRIKEFNLSKLTQTDLMAISFRADFTSDDDRFYWNYRELQNAKIIVKVIDQERIIERLDLTVSSYPTIKINPLILDHRYIYQVFPDTKLNRLTFFCQPVSLLEPINIIIPNRDKNGLE